MIYDPTYEEVLYLIQDWHKVQKDMVPKLIHKYGLPTHICDEQILWENCLPWKRTIVYKNDILHNAPTPHRDFLGSFVDFHINDLNTLDELYKFDGSLYYYRTPGEIEARCHDEHANFAAVNLANDICNHGFTAQQAGAKMVKIMEDLVYKKIEDPYTTSFNFSVRHNTQDPATAAF